MTKVIGEPPVLDLDEVQRIERDARRGKAVRPAAVLAIASQLAATLESPKKAKKASGGLFSSKKKDGDDNG